MKKMNNTHLITNKKWAITLIQRGPLGKNDPHAMIGIEARDEYDQIIRYVIDLRVSIKNPLTPKIIIKSLQSDIEYYDKSDTWLIPRSKV
jgi:hypothetical protein